MWSNKRDLNQKSDQSSEYERTWRFYSHFSRKMVASSPKSLKKVPISLFFWTPTRFLIQIFFIGPDTSCSSWKYMIARHYSSLLVLTAHFQEFSSLFPYHQKGRKWRKMNSKDEQWRDIIDIHKVRCISGPINEADLWAQFFKGMDFHCSLWIYVISRHCCSLLLFFCHFTAKMWKWLKMSSNEQ